MRRFFTLTLLSALSGAAVNPATARQRAAAHVAQEAGAGKPGRPAADEDFARVNREVSKLTGRLAEDRKFADKFVEAARAQDRAKTEALAREAGVRGDIRLDAGSVAGDERTRTITITICINKNCVTIIIRKHTAE